MRKRNGVGLRWAGAMFFCLQRSGVSMQGYVAGGFRMGFGIVDASALFVLRGTVLGGGLGL